MHAHMRARMERVTVTFLKTPFLLQYQGFQRVVVGNKVTERQKSPERVVANRADFAELGACSDDGHEHRALLDVRPERHRFDG